MPKCPPVCRRSSPAPAPATYTPPSHNHSRSGNGRRILRIARRRLNRLRQPEIQHLHRPVGLDLNIPRLQVAVHDSFLVRRMQRIRLPAHTRPGRLPFSTHHPTPRLDQPGKPRLHRTRLGRSELSDKAKSNGVYLSNVSPLRSITGPLIEFRQNGFVQIPIWRVRPQINEKRGSLFISPPQPEHRLVPIFQDVRNFQ